MSDNEFPCVKAAAVQAAPIFLLQQRRPQKQSL